MQFYVPSNAEISLNRAFMIRDDRPKQLGAWLTASVGQTEFFVFPGIDCGYTVEQVVHSADRPYEEGCVTFPDLVDSTGIIIDLWGEIITNRQLVHIWDDLAFTNCYCVAFDGCGRYFWIKEYA